MAIIANLTTELILNALYSRSRNNSFAGSISDFVCSDCVAMPPISGLDDREIIACNKLCGLNHCGIYVVESTSHDLT